MPQDCCSKCAGYSKPYPVCYDVKCACHERTDNPSYSEDRIGACRKCGDNLTADHACDSPSSSVPVSKGPTTGRACQLCKPHPHHVGKCGQIIPPWRGVSYSCNCPTSEGAFSRADVLPPKPWPSPGEIDGRTQAERDTDLRQLLERCENAIDLDRWPKLRDRLAEAIQDLLPGAK